MLRTGNLNLVLRSPVKLEWILACFAAIFTILSFVEAEYVWLCSLMLPIIWLTLGVGFGPRLLYLAGLFAFVGLLAGANPWSRGIGVPIVSAIAALLLLASFCAKKLDVNLRWLWASVVLAASLNAVGGAESGPGGFTNWLESIGLSPEVAWQVTILCRKTLHFAYYGMVALTAHFGVRSRMPVWAIAWALIQACFDEYRQSASPGRTGSVADVLLDMAGAVMFVGIAVFLSARQTGSGRSSPRS